MANELLNGTRRTGDFFASAGDAPTAKATLARTDQGISITIAWSHPDVPYANWFLDDSTFPWDGQHLPNSTPKRVMFYDSHGRVLLIRCRAFGYHANYGGPGSGTLWARAAIMDVFEDKEFDRPHGLQTEISGLREWLGSSSWEEQIDRSGGRVRVTLRSLETNRIEIGEHEALALYFRSDWGIDDDAEHDRRILLNHLWCITRGAEPKPWDDHMQLHRAVRDLLVISRWRNESCVPVRVLRTDAPLITMDGKTHGDLWHAVVVAEDQRELAPTSLFPHLIKYEDIGPDGVMRWVALRNEFKRALDPVISSLDLENANVSTLLAHTGPGLEALGYLLMVRDGVDTKVAAHARLLARFERVLRDVSACLPFDGDRWAAETASTYNALKHANRERPDDIEILSAWARSIIVVRAWVACELGIEKSVLKGRFKDDRQPYEFTKTE